jgi:hypothetical protein
MLFLSAGVPGLRRVVRAEARLSAQVRLLQEEGRHGGVRQGAVQEELPPAVRHPQPLVAAVLRPGDRNFAK